MDNKKVSDSLNKSSEQGKSRRSFIKKSSVVAGVSMLPASNVWGACNVSGVSGGSQHVNETCMIAPFIGGFKPYVWKKLLRSNSHANRGEILNIVTGLSETEEIGDMLLTEYYYQNVRDFLVGCTINFYGVGPIPSLHINIGATLMQGSTASHTEKLVAALFASITLGFVKPPAQFHYIDKHSKGLTDYLEHVWGSLNVNRGHTVSIIHSAFDQQVKIPHQSLMAALS